MKRSLVILLSAVSISTMTAGSVAPVWAEAAQTEAAKAEDTAEAEL